MEMPSTPPWTYLGFIESSYHDIGEQKEIAETPLPVVSTASQDESIEIKQRDYKLNKFTAKLSPEHALRLHRFIEITETIVSELSKPESTTEIKINKELRAQIQQILLDIPFEYPKFDWRTLQENVLQYLPAILCANYPNAISSSNIDQFAFGIKDVIKRAVLATPRKETSCPYANRWWNPDITILRRQSNRLRNRYRRTRSEYEKIPWREKANEYHGAVKMAKDKVWEQFTDTSPSSTSIEQYSTNLLRDCELSQEIRPSIVYYEANTNVSTAMFIKKLETLL